MNTTKILAGITDGLGKLTSALLPKAQPQTDRRITEAAGWTTNLADRCAKITKSIDDLLSKLPKTQELSKEREEIKTKLSELIARVLEAGHKVEIIRSITDLDDMKVSFASRRSSLDSTSSAGRKDTLLPRDDNEYVDFLANGREGAEATAARIEEGFGQEVVDERLDRCKNEILHIQVAIELAEDGLKTLELRLSQLVDENTRKPSGRTTVVKQRPSTEKRPSTEEIGAGVVDGVDIETIVPEQETRRQA